MAHSYEFPRPSLTVDCVIFGLDDSGLKVLLIQRGQAPFEGQWALPGGFVHMDETIDEAALALDVLENAHPVVMAGVFEFDGAAAIALQAIVLDGRDGDAVAVGVVGHGGVRRWRGGDHGQDRRARQP